MTTPVGSYRSWGKRKGKQRVRPFAWSARKFEDARRDAVRADAAKFIRLTARRPLFNPRSACAEAAEYIGVDVTVRPDDRGRRMPKPKLMNGWKVWQRQRIDECCRTARGRSG